jgi:GNAT superfamily N-acetyltransferase
MASMRYIDFQPEHAAAFKALNVAWISKLFAVEAKDLEVLDAPVAMVIERGGHIVMAMDGDEPVGCCALMRLSDGGFEVGKMAVADSHKGQGVGNGLMQACVDKAKALGAPRLYLETNSSLAPALAVYRRHGFVEIKDPARTVSPYARADVWMEVVF